MAVKRDLGRQSPARRSPPAASPARISLYIHATPIVRDLPLLDGHVEPGNLAYPEIAQGLARGLHRVLDGVLPGHLARSHQVRHPIDAVVCHGRSPSRWWRAPLTRVCGEDSRGSPAEQAAAGASRALSEASDDRTTHEMWFERSQAWVRLRVTLLHVPGPCARAT